MSKNDFLDGLNKILRNAGVPNPEGMIEYYDEMICDRMEDGMTEEEAVGSLPDPDKIVEDALLDMPIHKLASTKVKKSHEEARQKGHGTLWVVLAIIGFPIWFPVLITFIVLLLTFMLLLYIFVGVLYICDFSFGISGLAGLLAALGIFVGAVKFPGFISGIGSALFFGALCVLLFKPIGYLARAVTILCDSIFKGLKKIII
ncbi:MAG: DUF1700 domain-containing protein [Lachnospiraceae bacterium]|nr:DUF1700 domain-containing protein [Lachnospiraceae bacterium]